MEKGEQWGLLLMYNFFCHSHFSYHGALQGYIFKDDQHLVCQNSLNSTNYFLYIDCFTCETLYEMDVYSPFDKLL